MNESDYRTLLGGYVSNILDNDERTMVEAHLSDCADCRQELAGLSDAADRLTRLARSGAGAREELPDIALLEAEGSRLHSDLVLTRTLRAVRSEQARRRRPRLVAAAATVAVLLVGGGVAGAVIEGRNPQATSSTAQAPDGHTFTAHDATTGVHIRVTVTPQKAGFSRLNARITDEPADAHCQLIAISDSGQREIASSWAVGQHGSGSAGTQVTGSVAIPTTKIRNIEVRTLSGSHIVSVSTG